MLGYFSRATNSRFQKILSGTLPECQTVWLQIRTDRTLVLIWVQTVCKILLADVKIAKSKGLDKQTGDTQWTMGLKRYDGSGVARTPKKLRTSNGDYWIKRWFSSIAPLFEMGTSIRGKNLLPEGANSFL